MPNLPRIVCPVLGDAPATSVTTAAWKAMRCQEQNAGKESKNGTSRVTQPVLTLAGLSTLVISIIVADAMDPQVWLLSLISKQVSKKWLPGLTDCDL